MKDFLLDREDLLLASTNHSKTCTFRFGNEGINVITSETPISEDQGNVIDKLGSISRQLQHLDISVTSKEGIKHMKSTVFINIEERRPVGLLTTCKVKLKEGNKRVVRLGVIDFAVPIYAQRHGIGKKLADAMLDYHHVRITQLAFNHPSEKSVKFLEKWYHLKSGQYWCFG